MAKPADVLLLPDCTNINSSYAAIQRRSEFEANLSVKNIYIHVYLKSGHSLFHQSLFKKSVFISCYLLHAHEEKKYIQKRKHVMETANNSNNKQT